ncbi:MAG: type II toxin-antitoxin system RelE/ParE family toxin [Clostridiales Family XIII bacterium]|nr:type II toxin-antitoxin system RelE/ParE family toxin [Clostridiales Family XIII bacterium]
MRKYQLVFYTKALRQLAKLDFFTQKRIQAYLNRHVHDSEDPRAHGKELTEMASGFWRYRIGDYRVICEIHDGVCEVIAMQIGHRSKIYS